MSGRARKQKKIKENEKEKKKRKKRLKRLMFFQLFVRLCFFPFFHLFHSPPLFLFVFPLKQIWNIWVLCQSVLNIEGKMWAAWNNSMTYRHHTIGLCDVTVPTRPDQLNVFSVADFKVQSAATWVVTMARGSYSTHARMLAWNNILSSSCIAMSGFKEVFT